MFSSSKGINLGQGSAGGGGGKAGCERRRISGRRFSPLESGWRLRSPDFLSQTPARLASIAFFPTAEPGARLVLHKTSYNIRTFQVVVVQWTSRKCTTKHDAREN